MTIFPPTPEPTGPDYSQGIEVKTTPTLLPKPSEAHVGGTDFPQLSAADWETHARDMRNCMAEAWRAGDFLDVCRCQRLVWLCEARAAEARRIAERRNPNAGVKQAFPGGRWK